MFTPGLIPGTIDLGITERLSRNPGWGWLGAINNPAINLPTQQPASNQISQNQLSNYTFGTNTPLNVNTNGEILGSQAPKPNTNTTIRAVSNPPVQQYNSPIGPIQNPAVDNINSGYSEYFNQLDSMLNTDLPAQRQSQEGIANNAYTTSTNLLENNKAQQLQALETTQNKSLKDLTSNVRNLFTSGNTYLGARGAADSSASNQYSYAISKMASKERGNIMSDIGARKDAISNAFNNESMRLKSELDQKMMEIANWFSSSQQQVKQMIATGQINRGHDLASISQNLYNQAISEMQRIRQENANKESMLQQWALNNSKSVDQVISTLGQLGYYQPQQSNQSAYMPQVTTEGQAYLPFGIGGSSTKEKENIFGFRS